MATPLPEHFKIIDMVEPDTEERNFASPLKTEKTTTKNDSQKQYHQKTEENMTEEPINEGLDSLPKVENKGTNWGNPEFRKRVLSALVLAPLVLGAVAMGGALFYTMVVLLAVLMMREWDHLVHNRLESAWGIGGVIYVTMTCMSLILLREESLGGNLPLLLLLLATVWATDIGAYFAGRQIGGPKLAPRLSPGKTWAGLFGGMLSAAAVAGALSIFFSFPAHALQGVLIGCVIAVVGQIGDLFESWLKRQAGVKDSGNLIPGHGGILDRVDGLTFTAPLLLAIYYLLRETPAEALTY